MFSAFTRWLTQHLSHKFIFAMGVCLLTASLIFLLLFIQMYRSQLAHERSVASASVNRALQAALENAMLKQDLDGLRNIINHLGQQENIRNAFIINPNREIRFASNPDLLGTRLLPPKGNDFVDYDDLTASFTQFIINEQGNEILRSINPVYNKPACTHCHGTIKAKPINGILFVDYDASTIREKASQSSLIFIGAGSFVVLLSLLTMGWFIRRFVLLPVSQLVYASRALSCGEFDTRVTVTCQDELGVLAQTFNQMAINLQNSLRQIEEQKVFLQSLIDAIPDGIRVIDNNHTIINANMAYYQQLKLPNTNDAHAKCYTSSYQKNQACPTTLITCPLHEINKTGLEIKLMTEHVCVDGSKLPVEVCAAPMHVTLNGIKQTFIVESIRDLTQTIEFSQEQKLSALGQLAAGVAHEIYNPLSSIRLALQSTLQTLMMPQADIKVAHNYLNLVDKQIDRCIDVTQRLLKLATPSGERLQLVSFNEAVFETVSLLNFESHTQNITIHSHIDEQQQYRVLGTESDIRMLILNLLQNAFHAMPQGGEINIYLDHEHENIRLTVTDTGCGIPTQLLEKIFEPFFSHRADDKVGTGLGLTICKAIVTRYKGQIEVHNGAKHGCSFIVTLPDIQSYTTEEVDA